MDAPEPHRVLVTGATGYVGGRLVPLLLARGYHVRVLARDRDRVDGRSWLDQVELVLGDVLNPATLPAALDGVDAAYYLIHSMGSHGNFSRRDLHAAHNFAEAAAIKGSSASSIWEDWASSGPICRSICVPARNLELP